MSDLHCAGGRVLADSFLCFRRARKLQIAPEEKVRLFSWGVLKLLILLSLPVILQNSFVSVGNLFIQVRINELAAAEGIGICIGR